MPAEIGSRLYSRGAAGCTGHAQEYEDMQTTHVFATRRSGPTEGKSCQQNARGLSLKLVLFD